MLPAVESKPYAAARRNCALLTQGAPSKSAGACRPPCRKIPAVWGILRGASCVDRCDPGFESAAPHLSRPASGEVRGCARELTSCVRVQRERSTWTQDLYAPAVRVRAGAHAANTVGGVHHARRFLALDWDVFGDRALAGELRALEERYRTGSRAETAPETGAVRSRYDLAGIPALQHRADSLCARPRRARRRRTPVDQWEGICQPARRAPICVILRGSRASRHSCHLSSLPVRRTLRAGLPLALRHENGRT